MFVVRRQSPSHGLTTPVDFSIRGVPGSMLRLHALTLIVLSHTLALSSRPRLALKADRVVCACTHYLVFKEPTARAPVAPDRRVFWGIRAFFLARPHRPRVAGPTALGLAGEATPLVGSGAFRGTLRGY